VGQCLPYFFLTILKSQIFCRFLPLWGLFKIRTDTVILAGMTASSAKRAAEIGL